MTTAADIIKGALRKSGIRAAETDIEPDEIADGLEDLNDWASLSETATIALGFTPVKDSGDPINIPLEAVGYFKTNLALYIASDYGAPIAQTLVKAADDSLKAVLNTFQIPIDVQFPDTLPVGSGNECFDSFNNQKFFDNNKKENF